MAQTGVQITKPPRDDDGLIARLRRGKPEAAEEVASLKDHPSEPDNLERIHRAIDAAEKVLIGRRDLIRKVFTRRVSMALPADGHPLLEGAANFSGRFSGITDGHALVEGAPGLARDR